MANDIIKKIFEIKKQKNDENIYMKGIDMSKFDIKTKIKVKKEKKPKIIKIKVKKEKIVLVSDDIYKIVKKLFKLYICIVKDKKNIKWKDLQQYIRDNIKTINENVKINKIMPWKKEIRRLLKKDKYKSIILKG
jgi:hypothetical protein